jgi:anthranilate phosphoribosyltransferase
VAEVHGGKTEFFSVSPGEFGLRTAQAEELRGGGREENAKILTGVLDGSIRGAMRDVVVLNGAAGLVAADLAGSLAEGLAKAEESIDGGGALAKLRLLQRAE